MCQVREHPAQILHDRRGLLLLALHGDPLAVGTCLMMLALSLVKPATSQGPADLATVAQNGRPLASNPLALQLQADAVAQRHDPLPVPGTGQGR